MIALSGIFGQYYENYPVPAIVPPGGLFGTVPELLFERRALIPA
jgi:hypothetical protein